MASTSTSNDVPMVGSDDPTNTPIAPTAITIVEDSVENSPPLMVIPVSSLPPQETASKKKMCRPIRCDSVAEGSAMPAKKRPRTVKKNGKWGNTNLNRHFVHVEAGEDAMEKLTSYGEQCPSPFYILSAVGDISKATLRHSTSKALITYECQYEINDMNGQFIPSEGGNNGTVDIKVRVRLEGPEGHATGGTVAGSLIAANPVMIVLGICIPKKMLKKKTVEQLTEDLPVSEAELPGTSGSFIPEQELHEQTTEIVTMDMPAPAAGPSAVLKSFSPGQQPNEHTTEDITNDIPTHAAELSAVLESFSPRQQPNEHTTEDITNDMPPTSGARLTDENKDIEWAIFSSLQPL